MLEQMAKWFFGSANDRLVKRFARDVERINHFETDIKTLTDDALRNKTEEFRQTLRNGGDEEDILHEAFAVVREAAMRTLGMRHFDVQLIGGIVLHRGMIAEMKTGEGKTLVATLAAYLNALSGKGVHIVTVNDYLASRDAEWMGHIYRFLGLTVGFIKHGMSDAERQEAYGCDIIYATNNELGFDYLRDNMKFSREEMVQRPFHFAVVDEVDSILIDEARTPLIISGPTEDNSALYTQIDRLIPNVRTEHIEKDEKSKSVTLNEEGVEFMESLLAKEGMIEEGSSLYDIQHVAIVHHVNQALKAHHLFTRDVDYIVKENKVVIIDEFTGRMMEGRRYSEGLHQALEAKEGAAIQNENQTLASITFQNYFRLYPKLSGMTGTAMTEAAEFADIYGLEVVEIPTNLPVIRQDENDEIYRTSEERDAAIIELIQTCHQRNQPILVGTVSIEKSESFSKKLKKAKIPHHVLNARYHEKEALIIAQAGRPGAVTIATNMAGRGTDIQLGGNLEMRLGAVIDERDDEVTQQRKIKEVQSQIDADKQTVKEAGGLYVIGTERHESRRIDNQLRGRSGRQGDPGASKFFISLEDDLMRIFGSERIDGMLARLGMEHGESIEHPWMNKAIERAQSKVEQRNYEIRKNLLKFDDVMNDQRKVIYEQRLELMDAEDVTDTIDGFCEDVVQHLVQYHIPSKSYAEDWDTESFEKEVFRIFGLELPISEWAAEEGMAEAEIESRLLEAANALLDERRTAFEKELVRLGQKRILLETLDQLWKEHLLALDHLRQGIGLRAYGQRDPLNEYKQEAFAMFEAMLGQLRETTVQRMAHLHIRIEDPEALRLRSQNQPTHESRIDPALAGEMAGEGSNGQPLRSQVRAEDRDPANPASWGKVSRNEPCPCGSGKKFKHCHGQLA